MNMTLNMVLNKMLKLRNRAPESEAGMKPDRTCCGYVTTEA